MTVRPTLPANHVDGDIVTATEWNLAVVQQGNWAQEVVAGTNTDKIPASAITGAVGYYPNILVNGGFEINQRWGTTAVVATTNYTPHADNWGGSIFGSSTLGMANVTSPLDTGSNSAVNLNYTHASGGAGQYWQSVENFAEYKGRTLFLSARVQASTTGGYIYIADGVGVSATARFIVNSAYNTLTTSLLVSTSCTHLYIFFAFDATCFAYVDNVMLAMAPAPIDYVQRPRGEEVLLTRRYYQVVPVTARWRSQIASETRDVNVPYPVAMAGTPTATMIAGTRTNIGSAATASVTNTGLRAEYIATAATTDTSAITDSVKLEYNVP